MEHASMFPTARIRPAKNKLTPATTKDANIYAAIPVKAASPPNSPAPNAINIIKAAMTYHIPIAIK